MEMTEVRYIDSDTGFYNEKYIPVLEKEAQKVDITNALYGAC